MAGCTSRLEIAIPPTRHVAATSGSRSPRAGSRAWSRRSTARALRRRGPRPPCALPAGPDRSPMPSMPRRPPRADPLPRRQRGGEAPVRCILAVRRVRRPVQRFGPLEIPAQVGHARAHRVYGRRHPALARQLICRHGESRVRQGEPLLGQGLDSGVVRALCGARDDRRGPRRVVDVLHQRIGRMRVRCTSPIGPQFSAASRYHTFAAKES
mgnify:CR=1 FL=1